MVGKHPEREDALVHLPSLPGDGDHGAPVDHGPQPVGIPILDDQ
jgi:hypothetical protein